LFAPGAGNENVVEFPDMPLLGFVPEVTATTAVSEAQLELLPLKSVTVYGVAPPVQLTVPETVTA